MKHFFLIPFAAVLTAWLTPAAVLAQVVVNPAALQQLAGIAPSTAAVRPAELHAARPKLTRRRPAAPVAVAMVLRPGVAAHVTAPAATPPAAKPAPEPVPALQPVAVNFTPGSAALPPGAAAALKGFCASQNDIAIDATAPGDPANPSVSMRLSLSRAFAVRDALTACGVPATRILPRALGNLPGNNNDTARVSEAK